MCGDAQRCVVGDIRRPGHGADGRHIAASCIQAFYRGQRCRRALRPHEDYKVVRAAATKLQAWFRQLLTLKRVLGTEYIPIPLNLQDFPVKVVGVTTEVVDSRHGGVVTSTRVEQRVLDLAKLTPGAVWKLGVPCRVIQNFVRLRKRNAMIRRIQRFARARIKGKKTLEKRGTRTLKAQE